MKLFFYLIITSVLLTNLYAIEPPKNGVTPPSNFAQIQAEMGKSYSEGYYAQKMNLRKILREKIARGEILEKNLVADTVEALVLLGKYSNSNNIYTQSDFQTKLFDGPNPTGTMTDFYKEISYNQLYFKGTVQGWFTVPGTQDSYVGTDNGLSKSEGPKFIYDLVKAADSSIDYSKYIQYYDAFGAPHIGMIAGVHTGGDGAAGANNIWSHKWDFRAYSAVSYTTNDTDPVSGKKVIIDGTYALEPELKGSSNTSGNLVEIGVFCHEFGHVFGLPDLYDTDNSSEGLGNWCLMAAGSWGGDGSSPQTPVHMSAWCKVQLGWVTPIVIDTVVNNLTIPNVEQNKAIYKIWTKGVSNSKEYFLVENRQKTGYDKNLFNSGLLIYHVDDAVNTNQDENHYLVDLMQADGKRQLNTTTTNRGDSGDPYPGSTSNTNFDLISTPSSTGYTGRSYVYVKNIHADGLNMIANLDNGTMPFGMVNSSVYIGNVDINSGSSVDKQVVIKNIGLTPLQLNSITKEIGTFKLTSDISYPKLIVTNDSLVMDVNFAPTSTGLFSGVLNISSNDPYMTGVSVQGRGYSITTATASTLYATSGSYNNGNLLKINTQTGIGTNIGSTLYSELKGIAVSPKTAVSYGISTNTTSSEFVIINAKDGDSYNLFTIDKGNMSSIAFDTSGNLYSAMKDGTIYSVNLQAKTIAPVCTSKVNLLSIAFDPKTNELWGSPYITSSTGKDKLYKINILTGDTVGVGKTGLNIATNGLSFDLDGNLYGITGSVVAANNLISINKSTGISTAVGSIGLKNITGISFALSNGTFVDQDKIIGSPAAFSLSQNYPNPFNPTTTIEYSVPNSGNVKITVYNLLGQAVETLTDSYKSAGTYKLNWNASNMASGIYFYEMKATGANGESFSQIKKMMLLK